MLQILTQVGLPAGWASWGLLAGIICDRTTWNSPKFGIVVITTLLAAIAARGLALPVLVCVPTFVLSSRLRVVGLTGSISVGKSAVSQRFKELKVPIIDADQIAHSVLERGKPAYRKVVEAFKKYPGIISEEGNIDRAELRKLVFADKALNRKLKQCTHMAIATEMLRQIFQRSVWEGNGIVILDAPLLFESKANILCKDTLVVHCSTETQIRRLIKRDSISEEQCLHAITSQMPQEIKMRLAGRCIPNDGSLSELHLHVDMAYKGLKAVAGQHITRVWASRIGRE